MDSEYQPLIEFGRRPIATYLERIRGGVPFAFSRWGNGEWNSVFGRTFGHNRSGHQYFPEMGIELRDVLLSRPTYSLGMQNLALRLYKGRIEQWLFAHDLATLDWVNSDVFYKESAKGRIQPLVDALKGAPALAAVGPPHLRKLQRFLGYSEFIEVPLPDCYLEKDRIFEDVQRVAETLPAGSVFSFSAAMTSNLVIDAMAKTPAGQRLILIDFGSIWDPYAGVKSRNYMKDMSVEVLT